MNYWEPSARQRASFSGSVCRYSQIDGLIELYSFSSNANRPQKPDPARPGHRDPMYFMTKSNLSDSIRSSVAPRDIFDTIRSGVAICEDWNNNLGHMFILNVPAGMSVGAWVGLAKFQPRGGESTASLAGGWLQYLIDLDAQLVHYLDGPIRTGR